MFQIVILTLLLQNIIALTKLSLIGPNPQYMDCKKINQNYNGFFGPQFFYDELSQYTSLTNLDKITFEMWFWVHSKMILKGKLILFSFVDGNSNSPYLNLMLYYYFDKNSYYLNLLNENLIPEIISLKLDQINDLYKESWKYVLLSIDQSSPHTFINLKFFSTLNYELQQIQETLVSKKLKYQFGPHSRITNEQLYGITRDYMACVNIANFNFINGWTTMDSEIYVDYGLQQVFSLKPVGLIGLAVNQLYDQILLKSFSNNIEFSGTYGLNIYKDTQIVYNFLEQMSSFTFMFWFKLMNIQSNFQFLSLTDDSILETSIGFGVDKYGKLLIYQIFSKSQVANINLNNWNHVIVSVLEMNRDENFISSNKDKMLRIFIGYNQVYLQTIDEIKPYKRLVIGPVFIDDQGLEFIDIQDIRIFNGYRINQSDGDCLLFVGLYCAICRSGTDYCYERNPYDDKFIIVQEDIEKLIRIVFLFQFQIVEDTLMVFTNNVILDIILYLDYVQQIIKHKQVLLIAQIIMHNFEIILQKKFKFKSINNQQKQIMLEWLLQSILVQMLFVFNLWLLNIIVQLLMLLMLLWLCFNFIKNMLKFIFLNYQQCVTNCPYKYKFTYFCDGAYIDYQCNPNIQCENDELDIGYYCLTQDQQTIGQTVGCKKQYGIIQYNKNLTCHDNCKYCFGSSDQNCLGCYSDKYYSPYTTSCLSNCNISSNKFKYTNKFKMICEFQCPNYLYTQNKDCVDVCSSGYVLYQKQCLIANSIPEFYAIGTTIVNYFGYKVPIVKCNYCPSLCQECTSPTFCKTCLNTYPIYQNQCLFSCYPNFLYIDDDDLNICMKNCNPTDLIYQNDNLFRISLKQCFKNICGIVKANKDYQTFKHQSDNQICSYPCDDYYGHPITYKCTACSSSCATCLNFANYCTSCYPMQFLQDSDCYDNCKSKFLNYITWTCEGSCSQGFVIEILYLILKLVFNLVANYMLHMFIHQMVIVMKLNQEQKHIALILIVIIVILHLNNVQAHIVINVQLVIEKIFIKQFMCK